MQDQGASLPNDGQLDHLLLHMQLETRAPGVLVGSYCSTYRVGDPFSSLGTFSSSSIGGPVFHPIADCEHPLLCLPGTSIASQETAISGSFPAKSCQCVRWCQRLEADYGMDPRLWQSLDGPSFRLSSKLCLRNSFHGYFFPILRRNEVSTCWSSFSLIFLCFANCILSILSFWANIHLVSTYQVLL